MSGSNSSSIAEKMKEVETAADDLANTTMTVFTLSLHKFDIEKNEAPHDAVEVVVTWRVPLVGNNSLERKLIPTYTAKKHLTAGPGYLMTGHINWRPLLPQSHAVDDCGDFYRTCADPRKESPNELTIYDCFGRPWVVKMKFTDKHVLDEVSIEHEPMDHLELVSHFRYLVHQNCTRALWAAGLLEK